MAEDTSICRLHLPAPVSSHCKQRGVPTVAYHRHTHLLQWPNTADACRAQSPNLAFAKSGPSFSPYYFSLCIQSNIKDAVKRMQWWQMKDSSPAGQITFLWGYLDRPLKWKFACGQWLCKYMSGSLLLQFHPIYWAYVSAYQSHNKSNKTLKGHIEADSSS